MLLHRDTAALIIVDIQERLAQVMERKETVVKNTLILVQAAKRLGIPIISTLQYPKGLGPMVGELDAELEGEKHIEKSAFDCCGEPAFLSALEATGRKAAVVAGMETHICVLQTAMSLKEKGLDVHMVADAACSRAEANEYNALARMERNGIEITNTESALFEWLGKAGTPEFKELSKLIK